MTHRVSLEQLARWFRWVGYLGFSAGSLGVIVGEQGDSGVSSLAALLCAGYFAIAPLLLHGPALRIAGAGGAVAIEYTLTPFAVALLAMPATFNVAALGTLLIGSAARDGARAILVGAVLGSLGWFLGRAASPFQHVADVTPAALWALLAVIAVSLPVAMLGRHRTLQQRRERQRVQARSTYLDETVDVLAAYLPEPVRRRIRGHERRRVAQLASLDRRWLTICFVDLTGFTALTERLAPECVVELVNDFSASMVALAEQHRAVVDKFVGDGVLLLFDRHPDRCARLQQARDCLSLLSEIRARFDVLEADWRRRGIEVSLKFHVGVASGYCSVGDFGSSQRRYYTVIGGPVNLAARLQALAGADHAMLDASTAGLLNDARLVGVAGLQIKGFSDPQSAYRLCLELG